MQPHDLALTRDTAAIERAARAIVYLAVDWSMPERLARQVVQSAISSLPDLGFECFAMEEDGPISGPWLLSHGWTKYPGGYGSLLWFENGKQVAKELLPGQLGAEAIIRKTLSLWGQPATEPANAVGRGGG
jgi:hypothetical protein